MSRGRKGEAGERREGQRKEGRGSGRKGWAGDGRERQTKEVRVRRA